MSDKPSPDEVSVYRAIDLLQDRLAAEREANAKLREELAEVRKTGLATIQEVMDERGASRAVVASAQQLLDERRARVAELELEKSRSVFQCLRCSTLYWTKHKPCPVCELKAQAERDAVRIAWRDKRIRYIAENGPPHPGQPIFWAEPPDDWKPEEKG